MYIEMKCEITNQVVLIFISKSDVTVGSHVISTHKRSGERSALRYCLHCLLLIFTNAAMYRRVIHIRIDDSEERITHIFRVEKYERSSRNSKATRAK
jgi:hypothetical protein